MALGEYGTLSLIRATSEKSDVVSRVQIADNQGQELISYPAWAAPVLSNGFLYIRGKRSVSVSGSRFAEVNKRPSDDTIPIR